jgi:hypothetical protein
MCLKSGMTLGTVRKERLCFLTLTTQYDKNQPEKRLRRIRKQNYAFTKLKQKIERYLQKAVYIRHCKKHKLSPFEMHDDKKSIKYSNLYASFRFKLKYFKLQTSEGGGVMHIVFRKAYNVPKIPFEWLSNQWNKIWNSPRINISEIKVNNANSLALYLVGQYFAKQPVIRMSYGYNWVFPSFRKSFKHIIEIYGFKRGLEIWKKLLYDGSLPNPGRQKRFQYRKLPKKTQKIRELNSILTMQTLIVSSKYLHFSEDFGTFPPIVRTYQSGPLFRACKIHSDGTPIIIARHNGK